MDLSPAAPQVVTLSPSPKSPVNVTIKTNNGDVLASFVTPLPVPKVSPPEPARLAQKADEELSAEEKYLKGRKYDLATNRNKARECYEKALADDAQYSPALRALAVLDFEAGLYQNAVERLEKALDRDASDGLSWYFLGVSHLRLRNEKEALRCAYKAGRCFGAASLGYDLAGRAFMRLGDYSKAVEAFETSVRLNPGDAEANDHLLLALYASGNTKSAYKHAQARIAQDPTALAPRAALALQSNSAMAAFVREARAFVGEDDFEMLQTALTFAELGLVNEAAGLLKAVCVEAVPQAQRSPMPLYYIAYFASLRSDKADAGAYLSQAARTYRDYIFPSRPETLEVLKYAIDENPRDAYAHLHIGNLYGHLGRLEEAAGHWRKAGELDPSLSIAFRNLGLYAWAVEEDLAGAEQLYRKAIAARPKDQTLYRDLADILLAANRRPEAIKVLESTPAEKLRRADVIIMLAQAYLDEQRYGNAIDLLESTPYFVNWEGQTITWDIFNKAHIERGRKRLEDKDFKAALQDFEAALTYPANIGVGRSNKPQEAPAHYWRGKALEGLGRLEDARSAWEQGAAGPEGSAEQNKYHKLCVEALSTQL
jgi:tetratricopeptide (TPR) repeat protein